jgi:ABC-2 type transport system permease protein
VQTVKEVQSWLPPGLAGVALQQASDQQTVPALESLAGIGLFVLASGGVLGLRLRAEYRGEYLGAAPARKKTVVRTAKAIPASERTIEREGELRPGGWGAIPAIVEKEVQSLLRTLPLLYAVGTPLILVLVVSGGFLRGATRGYIPMLAFPLCVFFAQLGFRQLFANNLGTEGPGIQLYFLSPTPMRTVLLAKNLLHSAVFVVAVVIAGFMATVRLGPPSGMVLAATVAFFIFVLPVNLALGNLFSLLMPYRVNPGRISRQRGSQASTLLSLLFQALEAGVGVLVFELCSIEGMLWLAIPVFLLLAAIATFAWLRILANSDRIASEHKDELIALLMKAE